MSTQQKYFIKIGDRVIFNKENIELFKKDTSSTDKAVQQYQQLVLGGIDQEGIVKALDGNLATISYPDGWELPVPMKYLIVL